MISYFLPNLTIIHQPTNLTINQFIIVIGWFTIVLDPTRLIITALIVLFTLMLSSPLQLIHKFLAASL